MLNYDDLLSESNQLRIYELSGDDYKFLRNFAMHVIMRRIGGGSQMVACCPKRGGDLFWEILRQHDENNSVNKMITA